MTPTILDTIPEGYLTVNDAAAFLGIPRVTVHVRCQRHHYKSVLWVKTPAGQAARVISREELLQVAQTGVPHGSRFPAEDTADRVTLRTASHLLALDCTTVRTNLQRGYYKTGARTTIPGRRTIPFWTIARSEIADILRSTEGLLTTKEVEHLLGYTRERIRQLREEGKLTATKVGRNYYYDLANIRSFLRHRVDRRRKPRK